VSAYRYRLLNVFAEETFSGNPLCVFEDGRGLNDATMQALALQFNLSETTFLLPPTGSGAAARVRIFTPEFEMLFAGHPTLGSAQVVRALTGAGDRLVLEMGAGLIPVAATGNRWELQANAPKWEDVPVAREALAAALGLAPDDLGAAPRVVDTGSRQILVPLASPDAVRRVRVDYGSATDLARACGLGPFKILVWAEEDGDTVRARFFFPKGGAVAEDPGTGSACANLGGWYVAQGTPLSLARRVLQGEAVGRRNVLGLRVDAAGRIFVAGNVIELGAGEIRL
jgi:PhzF family phenazine biosynthesis protein